MNARMKISLSSASLWRDGADGAVWRDPPSRNARAHHAGRAAQDAHLPGELARRVHHDQLLPGKAGAHDLDAPRENDEHRAVALAGLGEDLAFARAHPLPVRFEARDLRSGQPGESLVPAGFDGIERRDFRAFRLPAH
jgi:hypothetical protein